MKALIIEDETAAAINLEALLRKVEPSLQIEAVLESVGESVEWLSSHPMPDLIFMDIHLADGESFRIFDRVEIDCPIIFTTAYDQYALEAFKVNSIDYLLKPITQNDLQRALDKLRRLSVTERRSISERVTSLAAEASKASQNVFLIQVRDRIRPLKFDEAAYFYTSDERVMVHTFSGEVLAMDKTLETLSATLPENDFFRANRQFIVSRGAIRDISVWFGSRLALNLILDTPERIIISKARVPRFKQWLVGGAGQK